MTGFPFRCEIYAASQWRDISRDVYGRDDVHIKQGRSGEASSYEPSEYGLTLNNRSGNYSPDNPVGIYYGGLDVNTPIRIWELLDSCDFTSTVSSAWPNTTGGNAWTTFGAGGALNASDYSSSGGRGRHSVPAANAYRSTYLAATAYQKFEVQVDLGIDTTDITGAAVSWNILFAGQSTSDYWRLAFVVQTDETISVQTYDPTGTMTDSFNNAGGFINNSAQAIRVKVAVEGWQTYIKCWLVGTNEPADWNALFYNFTRPEMGWIGLQSRRETGNTNGTIVFTYDNFEVHDHRFNGEVAEWPTRWDKSLADVSVPVEAGGVMRRIGANNTPAEDPVKAFVLSNPFPGVANCKNYWPLLDRGSAESSAPLIGRGDAVLDTNGQATSAHWGHGALNSWLQPGMAFFGNEGLRALALNTWNYDPVSGFRFDIVIKPGGDQNWIVNLTCITHEWRMEFNPSTKHVLITKPGGGTNNVDLTDSPLFDGAAHVISLSANNASGNTSWQLAIDEYSAAAFFEPIPTTEKITSWYLTGLTAFSSGGSLSAAHAIIWDADFGSSRDVLHAVAGFPGEQAGYRLGRILPASGVPVHVWGDLSTMPELGVQSLSTASAQIDEVENADMGLAFDNCYSLGVVYRALSDLISQTPVVTLDFNAGEFAVPFEPNKDDRLIANDVLASSPFGGERVASLDSGPMSTAAPKDGGVGRYYKPISTNLNTGEQLQSAAEWAVNIGTARGSRFPSVTVNFARLSTAKAQAIRQVRVGDWLQLVNLPVTVGGSSTQMVIGYEERINKPIREITFVTVPADPYRVLTFDDTKSRLAMPESYLGADVTTTGATSVQARTYDNSRWSTTDVPYPVTIGGEDMTATAATDPTPALIAVGTAAHADNASVTPGLPGASTGAGHLLLLLIGCRNGTVTINKSAIQAAGYIEWSDIGEAHVWAKIHSGSEVAPTITPTGGAAGDTISAQIASFSDAQNERMGVGATFTAAAQNIATPAVACAARKALVIWYGVKLDDWTSVATITAAGAAEIGEPSTTLGNDLGIVWDYKVTTTGTAIDADSFVVTGGAAANSKGGVLVFPVDQVLTVTRAVNGVAKTHVANGRTETARINVTRPYRLGRY